MTCIGRGRLEAYALGQLDEAAARDVRAHLAACPGCAEEAAWLAAERRLFTRRAALPAPAPPPFAAVMQRAREGGEPAARAARGARIWSAIAAVAALVGLYTEGRPTSPGGDAAAIVAEPAPHGEACVDPIVTARAVACEEDEFGACLLATPGAASTASASAEGCAGKDVDEPAAPSGEEVTCHVTCDGEEPHGDEALESRARGERAP